MFEMNSLKQNAADPAESRGTGTTANRPATIAMIGSSIRIKGDVRGDESLMIQGQVEGTVTLKGNNLIIGQEGRVTAAVHAHTITIEGTLQGDAFGEDRVILKRTASVRGNISAPQVSMEEGARFKGSMDMDARDTVPASRKEVQSATVSKLETVPDKTAFKQSGDAG